MKTEFRSRRPEAGRRKTEVGGRKSVICLLFSVICLLSSVHAQPTGTGGYITDKQFRDGTNSFVGIGNSIWYPIYGNPAGYIAPAALLTYGYATTNQLQSATNGITGGNATNAIGNNNGTGTNLTVYGTLTSTNMMNVISNIASAVGGSSTNTTTVVLGTNYNSSTNSFAFTDADFIASNFYKTNYDFSFTASGNQLISARVNVFSPMGALPIYFYALVTYTNELNQSQVVNFGATDSCGQNPTLVTVTATNLDQLLNGSSCPVYYSQEFPLFSMPISVATNTAVSIVFVGQGNGVGTNLYNFSVTCTPAQPSAIVLSGSGLTLAQTTNVVTGMTNGLATTNWVNTTVQAATNGLTGGGVTLGGVTNVVTNIVQSATNSLLIPTTNQFITLANATNVAGSLTNGLATTNYVNVATNGHVTASITNGLATTNYVNVATNGHVTASITNGLATTNYVNVATNGFVTQSITNGLVAVTNIGNSVVATMTNFGNAFYGRFNGTGANVIGIGTSYAGYTWEFGQSPYSPSFEIDAYVISGISAAYTFDSSGNLTAPFFIGNGVSLTNAVGNGFVDRTITNGLATTNYVNTITNGLATTNYAISVTNNYPWSGLYDTNGLAQSATNNYKPAVTNVVNGMTNGLATTNYVNVATNGFVTQSITNGLVAVTNIGNSVVATMTNAANQFIGTFTNGTYYGNGIGLTNISITGVSNLISSIQSATNSALATASNSFLSSSLSVLTNNGSGYTLNTLTVTNETNTSLSATEILYAGTGGQIQGTNALTYYTNTVFLTGQISVTGIGGAATAPPVVLSVTGGTGGTASSGVGPMGSPISLTTGGGGVGAMGSAGGAGGVLNLTAGNGGKSGDYGTFGGVGGDMTIATGAGAAPSARGGNGARGGNLTNTFGQGGTGTSAGGKGGSWYVTTGTGGGASGVGGAGGDIVFTSGSGYSSGGGGSAGGVFNLAAGVGGDSSNPLVSGGTGGKFTLAGGAGGNATQGTANGGAGGNFLLNPGAGGTSSGGTPGAVGFVGMAVTAGGSWFGDVRIGLTNVPAAGVSFSVGQSASVVSNLTAGYFIGNGGGLTNIPSTSITGGLTMTVTNLWSALVSQRLYFTNGILCGYTCP